MRLRVTDNEGAVKDVTKTVNVSTPPNDPPTPAFTVAPGVAEDARERDVHIRRRPTTARSQLDGWDSTATTTSTTASGSSFTTSYAIPRHLHDRLRVTDDKGESAMKTKDA